MLTKLNWTHFGNTIKNGEHRITVLATEGVKREVSMLVDEAYLVKLSCARDAQHQFYKKNTVPKKESF